MKRVLQPTSGFVRMARRLSKSNSQMAESLNRTLKSLEDDAFQPSLKTHKLKGDLSQCWACSAGYDLRIVFQFVEHDGREDILLLSVGTHGDVY